MKIINFYAGPGAGKSTTASGLFHKMKLTGFKVELVTEYAKDLVYSKREDMFFNQDYIFAKQRHRIDRLKNHDVEWVITDSPLLLSLVYPEEVWEDKLLQTFREFVLEMNNNYDNINYYIERRKLFEQYGRKHNEEQSKELDNKILNMLNNYDVKYTNISGNQDAPALVFNDIINLQEKERYKEK